MTTRNPFADRIATAATQGYIGKGTRTVQTPRRSRVGAGSRLAELNEAVPATQPVATARQIAFMTDLFQNRDLTGETRPKYRARLLELSSMEARAGLTVEAASAFIDYLLTMPKKGTPSRSHEENDDIPAGRYAVPNNFLNDDPSDNGIAFFKVDAPTEGTWAGYVFVTRQSSDDFLRMSRRQQDDAKSAIRDFGFQAATRLYGMELGVCGICGRTLTDQTSREDGIGPTCKENMGW